MSNVNFSKYRVSESMMLGEMMDYCNKILAHRRKNDKRYSELRACISTRTGGVEIIHSKHSTPSIEGYLMLAIRYDDRNNSYYFMDEVLIEDKTLKVRVMIENKDDFYLYFNNVIQNMFTQEDAR